MPVLAGELRRQVGVDDVRGQRRADHAAAEAQDVAVVVLDRLVRRVGVVGDDGADLRELAGRHRDPRAGTAHQHGTVGLVVAHRFGGEAGGVGIVDRIGRPRAEVGDLVARGRHRVQHHRLQRKPGMVERARDPHDDASPEIAPCRFWPDSSAYSWAAISAAPSTPARGPWRAIRIVVLTPRPGTTWRNAASRAGSSRRSPARETPPPITTSSGSKVLMALAIPMPSRSPSTRRHHKAAASPASAPVTTSWPSITPLAVSCLPT